MLNARSGLVSQNRGERRNPGPAHKVVFCLSGNPGLKGSTDSAEMDPCFEQLPLEAQSPQRSGEVCENQKTNNHWVCGDASLASSRVEEEMGGSGVILGYTLLQMQG